MQAQARVIVASLVGLVTLAAVAFAVHLSLDPRNYFFYAGEDRSRWAYDPWGMALFGAVMVAEATVLLAAVIAPRPSALWQRCLLGLVVLWPWAVVSTMAALHMPLHVLFHHLWVWSLVAALVLILAISGLGRLWQGPR